MAATKLGYGRAGQAVQLHLGGSPPHRVIHRQRLWPLHGHFGHLNGTKPALNQPKPGQQPTLRWPKKRWGGQRNAGVAKETLGWPKTPAVPNLTRPVSQQGLLGSTRCTVVVKTADRACPGAPRVTTATVVTKGPWRFQVVERVGPGGKECEGSGGAGGQLARSCDRLRQGRDWSAAWGFTLRTNQNSGGSRSPVAPAHSGQPRPAQLSFPFPFPFRAPLAEPDPPAEPDPDPPGGPGCPSDGPAAAVMAAVDEDSA